MSRKNYNKRTIKIKKQKIIGTQKLLNPETGEIIETVVIEKNVENDFNFHKIWLTDLIHILDIIGGKKLEVFKYLMNKMRDTDNIIICRYKDIEEDLKVSKQTIRDTIKLLLETDFMRRIQNGVYQINPNIIVKGSTGKRMNLLIQYNKLPKYTEKDKNE